MTVYEFAGNANFPEIVYRIQGRIIIFVAKNRTKWKRKALKSRAVAYFWIQNVCGVDVEIFYLII